MSAKKSSIKLTEKDIILAMTNKGAPCDLKNHLVVPNVSTGLAIHECDLLSVTNARYATEIEIKISVADTKKDKLKKHQHKSNKIKYLYFAMPLDILDKARQYIPEHAGIYSVKSYYWRKQLRYKVIKERPAKVNPNHRKLTVKEYAQLQRLAAMRYFTILRRYVREKRKKD